MNEVLLSAKNLTKKFGGLAAVDNVSIDLYRDHIHAVIGPNGAGKSTLTNLLSGDLPPTSGTVAIGNVDVTGWTPEKISRQGLGRSYQKTNIFLQKYLHLFHFVIHYQNLSYFLVKYDNLIVKFYPNQKEHDKVHE